jgi:hypothetical protein
MGKRWTNKELRTTPDKEFILQLLDEKQKSLNASSPLAKKCKEIQAWLETVCNEQIESNPLVENGNSYDLPYWGDDAEIASAITFVLENIPEPVRNFALNQCIFTSIDVKKESAAYYFVSRQVSPQPTLSLIVLSENYLYKSSFRYRMYIQNMLRYDVAYGLADAYLNLNTTIPEQKDKADSIKQQELTSPDHLVEQWGFRLATGSRFYEFYLRNKKASEAEKKWNDFTKLFPG